VNRQLIEENEELSKSANLVQLRDSMLAYYHNKCKILHNKTEEINKELNQLAIDRYCSSINRN